ncbi:MAG TPA: gamma-glutamyltransferase, partial [Thiotrichales bacterium]|nr:gamma-glutamyltransferase [Thiotrichales bacterium]
MRIQLNIPRLLSGAFLFFTCSIFFSVTAREMPGNVPEAAIASAHPLATQAGVEILNAGGNAFDAAVAVTAVLAVVEPYSSGIGGGGFWLLHRASDNRQIMIDGRERAPLKAHRDMYLDAKGEVIPKASINGPLAAGIPGEPAALVHLTKSYGRLSLAKNLAPAIRLAEKGFPVDKIYRQMAGWRKQALLASPDAAKTFLRDNKIPEINSILKQPDLALTLRMLAEKGNAGFYQGKVAEKLVKDVQQAGGIWTLKDLAEYTIVEREPVKSEYKGMKIISASLPSSGGVVLAEMLNILEGFDLQKLDNVARLHVMTEAMRRAYRDRAEYLGDSDFVKIPQEQLISKNYAAGLRQSVRLDRATPSSALAPTVADSAQGNHTTHFSIIDSEGNRVAATLSINYPFGACFVPPGTGVLLNNEMDDFSAKPGVPNVYGLVGAEANAIEPGKRMLSSMSPTFLETENRVAIL